MTEFICDNCQAKQNLPQLYQRITSMEKKISELYPIKEQMNALQADTSEIVAWVRNGKLGYKIGSKFFSYIGRTVIFWIGLFSGLSIIYTAYIAYKHGSFPGPRMEK